MLRKACFCFMPACSAVVPGRACRSCFMPVAVLRGVRCGSVVYFSSPIYHLEYST